MKSKLVAVILTSLLSGIASAGLDQETRLGNIIAVYKFESREDSGPNKFDGTLNKGAQFLPGGKFDKSLSLEGDAEFRSLNEQFFAVGAEFSIVAWLKMPGNSNSISISCLGFDDNGDIIGAIVMQFNPSANVMGGHYWNIAKDTNEDLPYTTDEVGDNKWHHFAVTRYAKTLALFIDGEKVESKRFGNYMNVVADNTLVSVKSIKDPIQSAIRIDELGFFESGFSVFEIKALYESKNGLEGFFEAMPVNPNELVSETWGNIKSGY